MEKNQNILQRCILMFINIFGSNNQKRLLLDHHQRGSKRLTGSNMETCSSESSQESVEVEKLIDDHEDDVNTDVSVSKKDESEEKFSEIIRRLIARKEGEIQTCKDLLEAFHVLNASKRVVVVEEEEEKSEEADAVLVKPKRKSKFVFSRKWRSEERRSRNKNSQIVVLKPSVDSVDIDCSGGIKKTKNGSNFSRFLIGLIKRRLGKKSGNDVIQSDETEKLVSDKEEDINVEDDYSKKIMSGLYIAAKKHLSEMLANGDIDMNLPDKEVPRILGKILSLPEFSSPLDSPRLMIPEHDSVPLSQTQQRVDDQIDEEEDSDKEDETLFTIDVSVPQEYENQNEDIDKEEKKIEIVPLSETCSFSVSRKDEFVDEEDVLEFNEEVDEENQSFNKEMINQDHSPSSPQESPPSSSVRFIEECKETVIDVFSPVSVLDPLFTDDDTSPRPRTRFSSAEMRIIKPLCIRFDEADDSPKPDNDVKTSIMDDEKELTLAYIETVVKSSGLSWEELLTRPFYSDQLLLLEPEQIDDIVFCSTELCDDKNLLYDCINEVLMDFCKNELNPGPWISFLKPEDQLISDTEIAVKVAKEGVCWHLSPLPYPHTLDQIVSKDMAKLGSWMDLRFEIDCISSYTSEMILDELVEEITTSLDL